MYVWAVCPSTRVQRLAAASHNTRVCCLMQTARHGISMVTVLTVSVLSSLCYHSHHTNYAWGRQQHSQTEPKCADNHHSIVRFDICLLLYVIRLAGWLKHCNISLCITHAHQVCVTHVDEPAWEPLWRLHAALMLACHEQDSQPSPTAKQHEALQA